MARDRFQNPANGTVYQWPVNHDEEDASGKTRQITATAPVAGVGRIRQQGEENPLQIRWSGKILHRAHLQQMWAWFAVSRTQSIYLYDFDNQGYEVVITDFTPQRHRTLRNPRDPSAPMHYWSYSITFDVLNFLAGNDMLVAGVAP